MGNYIRKLVFATETPEVQSTIEMESFDSFTENILNDETFRNQIIYTSMLGRPPIHLSKYLNVSIQTLREKLLQPFYGKFQFENLKMIVIASSAIESSTKNGSVKYNNVLAMVAEDGVEGIPVEVTQFIATLNEAFALQGRGFPYLTNANYDFKCHRLMNRVLFINASLSKTNAKNQDFANIALTVKFINDILQFKREQGQPLAVLDLRRTMHRHSRNYNANITRDGSVLNVKNRRPAYFDDEHFEIVNPDGFHLYTPFGHPGRNHFDLKKDASFYVSMLRRIQDAQFPIKEMYQPIGRPFRDF